MPPEPSIPTVTARAEVLDLLESGFRNLRILVVGDIMLDRYIVGDVDRISPEAPVPVLRQARTYSRPGGAANVAMNLAGLGIQATLCGLTGNDPEAQELLALLHDADVDTSPILTGPLPTITKTRAVSRTQQLLRVDIESRDHHAPVSIAELQQAALAALVSANAIILSDYAKGALTEDLCRVVIHAARARRIPVLVDPKARDLTRYRGATTICPNLQELAAATGVPAHDHAALLAAARDLLPSLDLDFLTVTMSERGIQAITPTGDEFHSPTRAREVFDVSGAGDTVIATLAASIAAGLPLPASIDLANEAAGIVVAKLGTIPVTAAEIVTQLTRSASNTSAEKVLDRSRAALRVEEWRSRGERIVFTNGCFDILHLGHVTLLEQCRAFGSKLVVALNADSSVRRLKGPTRPINGEHERARIMAALAAVDLVVLFDEDTPLELIRALRPNVLVKGGDYNVSTVVGHEDVASWGGRVEIIPTVQGFSTTGIVQKMQSGVPKK